jgi:glutamate racemase
MTIGIIDSGLGGYSIFHALHQAYPQAAFHFLADQKNAPYGNKTALEIQRIATKNIQWFINNGIHEIVIACNTMNAVALPVLKERFPNVFFHEVVQPTVEQIPADTKSLLVVATKLTIQSEIYTKALRQRFPMMKIHAIVLPELVSMVEGMRSQADMQCYIEQVLPQESLQADGMILGCTHYPLARPAFNEVFKQNIYDSIQVMVDRLKDKVLVEGEAKCFTTQDAIYAHIQVKELFQSDVDFTKIEVDHETDPRC